MRAVATTFAALLFDPAQISERALSHGFAVALAGFDLEAPDLLLAAPGALPRWSVAFYRSRDKQLDSFAQLEHASELFDQELPPGVAVLGGASEGAVVYAIVYSDEIVHDMAYRFCPEGNTRHGLAEGDDGLSALHETDDDSHEELLAHDAPAVELDPHRGTTFLSRELGFSVLPSLVRALFEADKKLAIRLVDPSPSAITDETRRLCQTLGRRSGRGAFEPPAELAACAPYRAFVAAYDWVDPSDPGDLYRELALGRVEGTLHFHRAEQLSAALSRPGVQGLTPLAALLPSALGGGAKHERQLGLAQDHERLVIVDESGNRSEAGPTFGELIAYLALGWKQRDEIEEDLIGALMLRAKVRVDRTQETARSTSG